MYSQKEKDMTLRKPPSGSMFNRKKKIKEKIAKVKESPRDSKDRQRYEELLMLLDKLETKEAMKEARKQQDAQGGKDISDADVERAKMRFYEDAVTNEARKQQGAQGGKSVSDVDLERAKDWFIKGAEKKYTGGKVGDKYYGGGPVYPRPAKSD